MEEAPPLGDAAPASSCRLLRVRVRRKRPLLVRGKGSPPSSLDGAWLAMELRLGPFPSSLSEV